MGVVATMFAQKRPYSPDASSGIVIVRGADVAIGLMPSATPNHLAAHQPISDANSADGHEVQRLYALFRAEPRDVHWAGKAEVALRAVLEDLLAVDDESPLDISCAATLCEISGLLGRNSPDVIRRLRSLAVSGASAENRMDEYRTIAVSTGKDGSTFTLYVRRGSR
ncbi:hypothetical protein [Sphingomonas lenta]|uniref:hypothetical protein n=1 Tax=Sphingomonas lenta TaxID=1141887 RepID=UPI001140A0CD|nr:hypothetical protein [Sphingomonas lenta]